MTKFKVWCVSLIMTGLLSFISVTWIDKPIAIWIHNAFGAQHISSEVADSPGLSIPTISAIVFVVLGLLAIIRRNFSKLETMVACCDISVLAAEEIKNQLKFAFGRTWPDSWAPQVPSLIRDNVYGFHFFHAGQAYESFPSGHAAVIAAAASVLWITLPKFRPIYAICIGAADVGLVLLNLHFVSDVIAGTFVGVSTGLFAVGLLTQASRHFQCVVD